jgi:single-stranded DNA-binding protein
MESINIAVLSGQITGDVKFHEDEQGRQYCLFEVTTYRSIGKGDGKELIAEPHAIKLMNPKTISRHLRKGKAVMVQGRNVPLQGILASSVHFPESRIKAE